MISRLRQIKTPRLLWIHISEPEDREIQHLRENFEFHPLDLEDCLNQAQRPKIDEYEEYIFLVLLFPIYNRQERTIHAAEIDFFVGPNYLITVDDNKHAIARQFFEECLKSQVFRERYMHGSPAQLFYELLRRLQNSIFPMLDHVSRNISDIEKQIFMNRERVMVREILLIKRNIVNFRRIMNAHKNIIKRIRGGRIQEVIGMTADLNSKFETLLDRTKEIWDVIEISTETIGAVQDTNDALISFKLNDIVRILTMISVALLPPSLLVALFSTRAAGMPLVASPYAFWTIVGAIITIMLAFAVFFKKKGWF